MTRGAPGIPPGYSLVGSEEVTWRITVSASNPDDPFTIYSTFALGGANTVVRPPPVPPGAAARNSRAQRAAEFINRLTEVAIGQHGEAEPAMPVTAPAAG